jgi:hypothetical protein
VNGGADLATPDGRFVRAVMARNQQHDPVAAHNRLFEASVDGCPGAIKG